MHPYQQRCLTSKSTKSITSRCETGQTARQTDRLTTSFMSLQQLVNMKMNIKKMNGGFCRLMVLQRNMLDHICALYLMCWRRGGPKLLKSISVCRHFYHLLKSTNEIMKMELRKERKKRISFIRLLFHLLSISSCFHLAGGTFPFLLCKREVVRLQILLGLKL